MSGGCLSCHELRVTKDVTRIKLTTATPVKLCIQCHPDKNAAEMKGVVHDPNVRDCLKCHDPHTSAVKNQLLKPVAGEKKEDNLCLGCHDTGLNVPAKGSRHAALDMGCDTCHVVHKSGANPDREFRYHLTKAMPALCLDCHDPKDAAIAKAHQNQPIDKADCITCHDPHQSKSPKLMQSVLHEPFAEKSCDTCHAAPKNAKVVLTQAKVNDLCVMCHEDQAKKIATSKVTHAGAQGDCVDCHSPHAGKAAGLLRPDPVNACLTCHPDQDAELKKGHPHQPASQQGCAICHEGHGSDNPKLLRAKNVNQLCLECHGPDSSAARNEKEHTVTIFNGTVNVPWNYFDKVPILPVRFGMGHPTEHHPVQDLMDPANPGKVKTQMNCLTCHQAHGSAKLGLLIKDQAANFDFCKGCHANGLDLKSIRSAPTGGK